MARETGSGKTPVNVTELIKNKLSETSLNAISKATGIGVAALHRYSRGIGEPTTATLEKLAGYFGVSVAYLRDENYRPWPEEYASFDAYVESTKEYLLQAKKELERVDDETIAMDIVLKTASSVFPLTIFYSLGTFEDENQMNKTTQLIKLLDSIASPYKKRKEFTDKLFSLSSMKNSPLSKLMPNALKNSIK
jgi:transcriptional regulator with XRE-family HTH domain